MRAILRRLIETIEQSDRNVGARAGRGERVTTGLSSLGALATQIGKAIYSCAELRVDGVVAVWSGVGARLRVLRIPPLLKELDGRYTGRARLLSELREHPL